MIIHSPFPFPLLSNPPNTHSAGRYKGGGCKSGSERVLQTRFKGSGEPGERDTYSHSVTCWCRGSSFSGRASCTISFGCSVEYPAMHTTAGGGGERDNGALCCVDGNKLDVRFAEWSEKLTKPDSFW